eukprot:9893055-Alexandrium_andersonii.AAC.1
MHRKNIHCCSVAARGVARSGRTAVIVDVMIRMIMLVMVLALVIMLMVVVMVVTMMVTIVAVVAKTVRMVEGMVTVAMLNMVGSHAHAATTVVINGAGGSGGW